MIGLDGSEQMLARADELLAPYGDRAELRTFHLEDFSWLEELFGRLLSGLQPGGALLFVDLMQPRTEQARKHSATAWEEEIGHRSREIHGDERAREFFERKRWNIYEYPDPMDTPSTLPEQLRWMEEAGFRGVDVFWARAGHALLGGYKPA